VDALDYFKIGIAAMAAFSVAVLISPWYVQGKTYSYQEFNYTYMPSGTSTYTGDIGWAYQRYLTYFLGIKDFLAELLSELNVPWYWAQAIMTVIGVVFVIGAWRIIKGS